MNKLLSAFLILISFDALAHPEQEQRISQLESRLKAMEAKLGMQREGGLKVKDFSGSKTGQEEATGLTPEQREEMMKKVEELKKKKGEQKEYLDELMGE